MSGVKPAIVLSYEPVFICAPVPPASAVYVVLGSYTSAGVPVPPASARTSASPWSLSPSPPSPSPPSPSPHSSAVDVPSASRAAVFAATRGTASRRPEALPRQGTTRVRLYIGCESKNRGDQRHCLVKTLRASRAAVFLGKPELQP